MSHKLQWICSIHHNHNPFLVLPYHQIFLQE